MALTSSGQLSVNDIHSHLLANSGNMYEGGYALRAMSLHGRWKLNNPVFDMEDRISDFYGRDFYWERSTRNISMVNGGISTIAQMCTSTQPTSNIYVSAYDYFTNYLNGNPTTFFSDYELKNRLALTNLHDTARDWIWGTDGVGIGTRTNTDCSPYQSTNNKYYGQDRCGTLETFVVQSECELIVGRYYEVCTSFDCMYPPEAPCEIYITGSAPSGYTATLEVQNCFPQSCGSTDCSGDPFIKK